MPIYSSARLAVGDSFNKEKAERGQHRLEIDTEGNWRVLRVMVSREQKRGVLHEKLQILRSVTHSHAVISIFFSFVCCSFLLTISHPSTSCYVCEHISSFFFPETIHIVL